MYNIYKLSNDNIELSICDYGATLTEFKYKGKDLIQGFDTPEGIMSGEKYMNATIGRVCNRIKDGNFELNGVKYQVPVNNGPNSLHGSNNGFDTKKWDITVEDNTFVCKYVSVDGEANYPGTVTVIARYELLEDGFAFSYEATTDKDTLCNITNHAFYNLNGPASKTILDQELTIHADMVGCVDADGCATGEMIDVTDTPFDFRVKKLIGKDIDVKHPQIVNGSGYDHHFVVKGEGFREHCSIETENLRMRVFSDLPGFQLYSSNFLDGHLNGKENGNYPYRSSICFETQYYPNAINIEGVVKPILTKGKAMQHRTEYRIEEK